MEAVRLIRDMVFWTLAVFGVFVALSALWTLLIGAATLFGPQAHPVFWADWLVLAMLLWLLARWWRVNHATLLSAKTVIDAPVETVWRAVDIHARRDFFLRSHPEIRDVPGEPRAFDLVSQRADTPILARTGSMRVHLVRRNPYRHLSFHRSAVTDRGRPSGGGSLQTFTLEAHPSGGTRVCVTEVIDRMSVGLLVTQVFASPCKEILLSLKHRCEGTEDRSSMAQHVAAFRLRIAAPDSGPSRL